MLSCRPSKDMGPDWSSSHKDRNVTCILISGYMHSYLQCEPGLETGRWPISRREKSTIWPAASALKDGTVVTLCAVPL